MAASRPTEDARGRQLLEQLLTQIEPNRSSEWSRCLIDELGSLGAVLAARRSNLARIAGSAEAAAYLQLIRRTILLTLREETLAAPLFPNSTALINYIRADIAHEPSEQLRVLFLDSKNRLLSDDHMSLGSVNEAPIYPREIMRRALEVNATAMILVHNHPSGDSTPSRADIEATAKVADAARLLQITLHDHIIVARCGWSSFRDLGLI